MSVALIDNDVLYKTAVYGLALPLLKSAPYGAEQFYILGAARFMISKKLAKRPPVRGPEKALLEFELLLAQISALEPTAEEIALAAELEYLAGQQGHALDGGESQLCAVLITRNHDYLFTGDKRAISAVSALLSQEPCALLAKKLVCLEQLIRQLLEHITPAAVRSAVCLEPDIDRALSNCFACQSKTPDVNHFLEGLNSYVGSIRTGAPSVLHDE